jgi:hypothetical protein
MKKIITFFILILLAAGVALYFGWVRISPGTFGLAHSSLSGTFDFPLESGHFYWFWQKLIPKNFYLYEVEKEPYVLELETSASLPKSENLTEFGRFDLKMNVRLQYTIDFESARSLFESGLLTVFHQFFKDEISSLAYAMISSFVVEGMTRYTYSARTFDYTILDELKQNTEHAILEQSRVYKLKGLGVAITYSEIPQIDVYVEALKRYASYMEGLYSMKEEELLRESDYIKKMKEEDLEIERLKKYGELINQYPELLKYFYIEKFGERADVMVLPQDGKTGFPEMLEPESRKRFLPESVVPGEFGTPGEDRTEEEASDEDTEEKEGAAEGEVEKKWYENLMFWRSLKSRSDPEE